MHLLREDAFTLTKKTNVLYTKKDQTYAETTCPLNTNVMANGMIK